jgi:hypothetical protein
VQYLCLCYHEARNVRHLVKAGYVPPPLFERLRVLPTNKIEAWHAMAPIRAEASELGTARAASDLFTVRFECDIEQLIELYRNPHWRSSAYGGNPWAEITGAVWDLQRALDDSNEEQVSRLLLSLPEMRHNTGAVGEKLDGLNRATDDG